jgi:UDP-N-acetylglucosamine--N-acetylmuramyl-(pentapeptide) pyrophosphoryl-undecaprenol N-acetylglucosamine transferase
VACGTWPTDAARGRDEGVHVGNPVRAAVLARRAPYIAAGRLADEPAGLRRQPGRAHPVRRRARGHRRLPDDLRAACASPSRPAPRMIERVREAYAAPGSRAEVEPFFDDMPAPPERGAAGDRRAGASSVADLRDRPPRDPDPLCRRDGDHQTANARGLVEAGAAS